MKPTSLLVAATLALFPVLRAFADDGLEHQLETRNNASTRKFDSQAHEYALQLAEANKQAQAEAERNQLDDTHAAASYDADVKAANKHARRKTALVLTTIAAAIAGGGSLTYSSAATDKASIQSGGYATAADINAAADAVNIKQGISFGAWGTAAVLEAIALGLAF